MDFKDSTTKLVRCRALLRKRNCDESVVYIRLFWLRPGTGLWETTQSLRRPFRVQAQQASNARARHVDMEAGAIPINAKRAIPCGTALLVRCQMLLWAGQRARRRWAWANIAGGVAGEGVAGVGYRCGRAARDADGVAGAVRQFGVFDVEHIGVRFHGHVAG